MENTLAAAKRQLDSDKAKHKETIWVARLIKQLVLKLCFVQRKVNEGAELTGRNLSQLLDDNESVIQNTCICAVRKVKQLFSNQVVHVEMTGWSSLQQKNIQGTGITRKTFAFVVEDPVVGVGNH